MARVRIQGKNFNTGRKSSKGQHNTDTDRPIISDITNRHRPKTDRKGRKLNKWKEVNMEAAIAEYRQGGKSVRLLARAWQVPNSTLQRRVGLTTSRPILSLASGKHASGKTPVLPRAAECQLAQHVLTLAKHGFPATCKDIQSLAFQYANKYTFEGGLMPRGSVGDALDGCNSSKK